MMTTSYFPRTLSIDCEHDGLNKKKQRYFQMVKLWCLKYPCKKLVGILFTSPKTNMDTQNDGFEKVDSFKIWPFLVSMLAFWGVGYVKYPCEI